MSAICIYMYTRGRKWGDAAAPGDRHCMSISVRSGVYVRRLFAFSEEAVCIVDIISSGLMILTGTRVIDSILIARGALLVSQSCPFLLRLEERFTSVFRVTV